MARLKLIEQEEFLGRAAEGMSVELALPFRGANGYFARGFLGEGKEVYATIRPENEDVLQDYITRTKQEKNTIR